MRTGDSYQRIEVTPGVYQCGCKWLPRTEHGDQLKECAIHKQATAASVRKFDRERKKTGGDHA